MASQGNGRHLPKFGEWDVNKPASVDGFTVIFNKAREQRRPAVVGEVVGKISTPRRKDDVQNESDPFRKDVVYKYSKRDSRQFPRKRNRISGYAVVESTTLLEP